ncbi:MAG: ADP-ribosylglycohydrolase family protein [Spirochaetales bacterium]
MKERAEAMVLASFAADAHALGAHWIYDTEEIERRFGSVDSLLAPPSDGFHSGKSRGSFTHYGDQMMLFLRCLARQGKFSASEFAADWRTSMLEYDGYIDHATRDTLATMNDSTELTQSGSGSTDLAGAARIAPLAYLYRDHHTELVAAAAEQASITHNSPIVIEASSMLGDLLWHILNGHTPTASLRSTLDRDEFPLTKELIRVGLDSVGEETITFAKRIGQHCATEAALPLSVHLIATHEGSLKSALMANVAAGGDSAARGIVIGMVLAAFHGREAIPDEWLEDLRAYREIVSLLEDLEARLHRNSLSA